MYLISYHQSSVVTWWDIQSFHDLKKTLYYSESLPQYKTIHLKVWCSDRKSRFLPKRQRPGRQTDEEVSDALNNHNEIVFPSLLGHHYATDKGEKMSFRDDLALTGKLSWSIIISNIPTGTRGRDCDERGNLLTWPSHFS